MDGVDLLAGIATAFGAVIAVVILYGVYLETRHERRPSDHVGGEEDDR